MKITQFEQVRNPRRIKKLSAFEKRMAMVQYNEYAEEINEMLLDEGEDLMPLIPFMWGETDGGATDEQIESGWRMFVSLCAIYRINGWLYVDYTGNFGEIVFALEQKCPYDCADKDGGYFFN